MVNIKLRNVNIVKGIWIVVFLIVGMSVVYGQGDYRKYPTFHSLSSETNDFDSVLVLTAMYSLEDSYPKHIGKHEGYKYYYSNVFGPYYLIRNDSVFQVDIHGDSIQIKYPMMVLNSNSIGDTICIEKNDNELNRIKYLLVDVAYNQAYDDTLFSFRILYDNENVGIRSSNYGFVTKFYGFCFSRKYGIVRFEYYNDYVRRVDWFYNFNKRKERRYRKALEKQARNLRI